MDSALIVITTSQPRMSRELEAKAVEAPDPTAPTCYSFSILSLDALVIHISVKISARKKSSASMMNQIVEPNTGAHSGECDARKRCTIE